MSKFLSENCTQVGFEIETTNKDFKIRVSKRDKGLQNKYDELNSLTNKTLAESANLEFVIDDVNIEEDKAEAGAFNVVCMIEFRTKPMELKKLCDLNALRTELQREVRLFYNTSVHLRNFRSKAEINKYITRNCKKSEREAAIKNYMWQYKDDFYKLKEMGLTQYSDSFFVIPELFPQHATISVPICNFLTLDKKSQKRILGYEASTLENFIENYLDKMLKTANSPSDSGGKLVFNTNAGNRTRMTPNIKTGLDKIILTANKEEIKAISAAVRDKLPKGIQIQIGNKAMDFDLSQISEENAIRSREYNFPEMSIEESGASLTSEEKVKPLFIDDKLKDIRVLVEYRNTEAGFLKALQAASKEKQGRKDYTPEVKEYVTAFESMDEKKEIKPKEQIFSQFFAGKELGHKDDDTPPTEAK